MSAGTIDRRTAPIVLASRSPRRRELLSLIVPVSRIVIQAPSSAEEPSFEGLHSIEAIEKWAAAIAREKLETVRCEWTGTWSAIVAADTVIIGEDAEGSPVVLGQPPRTERWREVVRDWFHRYYFGRTHRAVTAVCACDPVGRVVQRIVTTRVTMSAEREAWLDWYLSMDEPLGKAGGYALQGLASVFVERVEGSLSNVVGLPLAETREVLLQIGAIGEPVN